MYKNINIRNKDFDIKFELEKLSLANVGAIVSFTGLVREQASHGQVVAIELEHYPAMTQKSLEGIVAQAQQRWPLLGVRVIHRIGYLAASEQIVLVAVASQHRSAAFEAAAFMMDFLKTQAPFWKKEFIDGEAHWVDAKQADMSAIERWR